MAAKDRAEQGAQQGQALIEALRENPYVQRLLADDDLRTQLKDTVDFSRSAFQRATKAKRPGKALLNDKKLQNELRAAFDSARQAQFALRDAPSNPQARSGGKFGRFVMLTLVGGVVALVASSALRDKVLDLLFGPEETFDYVPTPNGNGSATATGAATPNAANN